jgi:hypothetical protein
VTSAAVKPEPGPDDDPLVSPRRINYGDDDDARMDIGRGLIVPGARRHQKHFAPGPPANPVLQATTLVKFLRAADPRFAQQIVDAGKQLSLAAPDRFVACAAAALNGSRVSAEVVLPDEGAEVHALLERLGEDVLVDLLHEFNVHRVKGLSPLVDAANLARRSMRRNGWGAPGA